MAVVEIVTFSLVPGADEGAFLAADQRVQTESIPNRYGFLRRTTARGPDGQWAVVTLWYDRDCADSYLAESEDHPSVAELMGMVDRSTLDRRLFTTLD